MEILGFISAIAAVAVALTALSQNKRSIASWSFAVGVLILTAEAMLTSVFAGSILADDVVRWENTRLLLVTLLPCPWLIFSLCYARGNHRQFVKKWRIALGGLSIAPLALAVVFRFQLVVLVTQETSTTQVLRLTPAGFAIHLLLLASAVLVLMNLERTFRASVGAMRWRIKFMILGVGLLFAARAYTSSQALLFHAATPSLATVDVCALLLASLLVLRSLLRHGSVETTVYPSHAVLHNSLTVLLAGLYLFVVGVLARVVALLGGDSSFALKAFLVLVVLIGLAALLLSDKVRLQTRRFVSRHFRRPMYDYRAVWRSFTEATARCVQTSDLCNITVALVSQLFQALSVTVWLLDDRRQNLVFGASTCHDASAARIRNQQLLPADSARIIEDLKKFNAPIDIDAINEVSAVFLRNLHPDEFRKGGNRICIPLTAGSECLGLMMLGDRVGGLPYSEQDLDLLKSVADQVAASLLNISLAHRLSQSKQLEAFQAMSSFFVHDLKNTASTLSLMLQNLPIHFNDPAFREDALRGISRTVTHINDLISRLSSLRQELSIKPDEADLNAIVSQVLKSFTSPNIEVIQDLRPMPRIRLDSPHIQNVLSNLLLNAREALSANGRIWIETRHTNDWAVVAVRDNGCGMSEEFVKNSLFRPFQTTKQKGIGIGMFQCKTIVEAHHGRIEVETEPGKGTAFRVLLPVT
jgi:putative PEP-CTERM system histidine kinase